MKDITDFDLQRLSSFIDGEMSRAERSKSLSWIWEKTHN